MNVKQRRQWIEQLFNNIESEIASSGILHFFEKRKLVYVSFYIKDVLEWFTDTLEYYGYGRNPIHFNHGNGLYEVIFAY